MKQKADSGFSREAHLRRDEGFLSKVMEEGRAYYLPVWRERMLFTGEEGYTPARIPLRDAQRLGIAGFPSCFLGSLDGAWYFSLALDSTDGSLGGKLAGYGRFEELRRALHTLSASEAELLVCARALSHWRTHARFCGRCGSQLLVQEGGHSLACPDSSCGALVFPRTDPAIIVLVTRGESCLLGRQATWPPKRWSALAGFVEPGESLEEAVAREVMEETGVAIERAAYFASQPWPFPASLMLGFYAEAASGEISPNDAELEAARWFSREEIRDSVRDGSLLLPYSYSISHELIREWFRRGGLGPLPL